jgi:amino acid efflux transporter
MLQAFLMATRPAEVSTPVPAKAGLQASIGLGQGVALYVSAILGAGVLVLPGQAASLAGPASLIAWAFSCLLGIPLALTFAALATRHPDAGGVLTYAATAFGPSAGGVTGWWYFIAGSVGQTIVPLTGGYYVAAAFKLDQHWSYLIALVILAIAVAANHAGIKTSSRIQVGLALAVAAVLLTASVFAIPHVRASNFTPFDPGGIRGIGSAVVILFFAFAGWEAVAHLAEEFRDSTRDLRRATGFTIVLVTILYLAIAFAVVSTGTYGDDQTDHYAIGKLLQNAIGVSAGVGAAVVAVIISLGTTNAFVASVSRLGYALSRDGWLPSSLGRLNRRSAPSGGIWLVGAIGAGGLVLAWIFGWGTQDIIYIPSTLVIFVYVLGTASAVKLLSGRARALGVIALVLTAATLPFVFGHLLVPIAVALVALGYRALAGRRSRVGAGTPE